MEEKELAKQTRANLLELARKQGLAGVSRLKKAVLIKRLMEAAGPVQTPAENKPDSPQKRFPVSCLKPPAFGKYQDLSDWQEKITSSKYEISLPDHLPFESHPAKEFSAPAGEKVNQAVLMVKNAYNLYLYWEISASNHKDRLYVRIYDLSGKEQPGTDKDCCYQIEVEGGQSSCYISIPEADHTYYARVGYLDRAGRFLALISSNRVHTPPIKTKEEFPQAPSGLSNRPLERLARFFAQGTVGVSSVEQAGERSTENRLESEWASRALGGLPIPRNPSSPGLSQPKREEEEKPRGFRFTLNTELILYGATEPDARVTVSGKPVQLRKDGTFSLRFALPDGVQVIPAVAVSADQVETRAITPKISRKTNRSQTGS